MITIKIGKGAGKSYEFTFGTLNAELKKGMENKTLKQLAKKLIEQTKIKNGEITLLTLEFRLKERIGK